MFGAKRFFIGAAVCCMCLGFHGLALAAPLTDPAGDTFGDNAVVVDIIEMDVWFDGANLYVKVVFANSVSPPWTPNSNTLYGFVELDVDQDPDTGWPSDIADYLGVATGLGVDYYIDFTDLLDPVTGKVALLDEELNLIAYVDAAFTATSMQVTVPLTFLGNDDGRINYAAIVSDYYDDWWDDVIPNQGYGTNGPVPPVADAGPDQMVFDAVTLDGSGSHAPEGGQIVSLHWDIRHRVKPDFNRETTGVQPEISNLMRGLYDVTLTVTDNQGISGTDQMLLAVMGHPGDIDGDGDVDAEDLGSFSNAFGWVP